MAKKFQGPIEPIDEFRWRIPKSWRSDMRVDGVIYSSRQLIDDALDGGGCEQVANVATLPGIVTASLAMPDIHWGYGFLHRRRGGDGRRAGRCGLSRRGGVRHQLRRAAAAERPDGPGRSAADQGAGGPALPRRAGGRGRRRAVQVLAWGDGQDSGSRGTIPGRVGAWPARRTWPPPSAAAAWPMPTPTPSPSRPTSAGPTSAARWAAATTSPRCRSWRRSSTATAAEALGLAEGAVTIMIHCGSRGLGHQVCEDYIRALRTAPAKYGIALPDRQLVCAPADSPEGRQYLGAMRAAANFAWANRQLLAHADSRDAVAVLRPAGLVAGHCARCTTWPTTSPRSRRTRWTGKPRRLCVHRKGATRAFPPGHSELPRRSARSASRC